MAVGVALTLYTDVDNELVCNTCSPSLIFVQDGATALYLASQNGHCEVVGMLLDAKADPNRRENVSERYLNNC